MLRFTYAYDQQPQPGYPDTLGIELGDQLVPPNLNDGTNASPWVGFLTNPTITLFFGSTVSIKTLRIYLQGNGAGSIYLPSSIIIGSNSFSIVDTGRSGWYEFTGAWTISALTVKFSQNSRSSSLSTWIFLGEIMVVASYNASLAPTPTLTPTPTPTLNPTIKPATGIYHYCYNLHILFSFSLSSQS